MFLHWKEERFAEREKRKENVILNTRNQRRIVAVTRSQFILGSLKVLYRDSMQGEGEANHDAEVRRQPHNKRVCDYSSIAGVLA